jgi:hypothetical protein
VQIVVGCAEQMGSLAEPSPWEMARSIQSTPTIATAPTTIQKIRVIRTFVKVNNLPPQQIDIHLWNFGLNKGL